MNWATAQSFQVSSATPNSGSACPQRGATSAVQTGQVGSSTSPSRGTGGDAVDRSRFVVVANRLPVDEVTTAGGRSWRRSPGGLVTALHPVLSSQHGTWVGWAGNASRPEDAPAAPFELDGMRLRPVSLSPDDVERY